MVICAVLLCLGAAALGLYIPEKLRGYSLKAVYLKSTVSVLFVAVAVCGWYASGTGEAFGAFVVIGLVFGLLGDVWLDLKFVFPGEDALFTYAGFAVFGVGHVLYVTGMFLRYGAGGWYIPLALALVVTIGNALLEKPMKLSYGPMKPIVIAYGFLLFSTVFVSGSLALRYGLGDATLNLIFIGSVLFAASDLVLSGTYFGGKERPVDIISNYLFYYPGQFLIALSLLFL